jgi:hypothetical protein
MYIAEQWTLTVSFFEHFSEQLLALWAGKADKMLWQLAAVKRLFEVQVLARRLLGRMCRETHGIVREWEQSRWLT